MAGCTTLVGVGALASAALAGTGDDDAAGEAGGNGTDGSNGAENPAADAASDDRGCGSEKEPASDDGADDEGDEKTETDGARLELSVSATDSVAVLDDRVDFQITVTNNGGESTTVPVALEIAHVDDELETLELDAGESGDAYRSIEAREFGSGEHDWTVAVGDEVETGTVTVESDDDYEEDRGDLELEMGLVDGATVRLQDGERSRRIGCEMTVFNHGTESVSATGSFELADQTKPIEIDLEGRASTHIREFVEVEAGDYEWTATVGDETATGTLHVVSD